MSKPQIITISVDLAILTEAVTKYRDILDQLWRDADQRGADGYKRQLVQDSKAAQHILSQLWDLA